VTRPSGRAAGGSPGRAGVPSGRARGEIPASLPRPRFTPRAAILALVICSIALSLAYPVREYIAQRRQIDRLLDQRTQIGTRLKNLQHQQHKLNDPVYIEKLARDRLHMCLPMQMCYEIVGPASKGTNTAAAHRDAEPWYAKLWSSVQQANKPAPAAPVHARRHDARRSGMPRNG
jgi:cell division protein FtsB